MKKEYIAPNADVVKLQLPQILADSVTPTNLEDFDGYGGDAEDTDEAD
jgi:hypothetical protein